MAKTAGELMADEVNLELDEYEGATILRTLWVVGKISMIGIGIIALL